MSDAGDRLEEATVYDEAAVLERLRQIFANAINITVPSDDTDLLESGLLDSLGLVELLLQVEHLFGLSIELEELEIEHFRSVRTIAATVAARCRRSVSSDPPMVG